MAEDDEADAWIEPTPQHAGLRPSLGLGVDWP